MYGMLVFDEYVIGDVVFDFILVLLNLNFVVFLGSMLEVGLLFGIVMDSILNFYGIVFIVNYDLEVVKN